MYRKYQEHILEPPKDFLLKKAEIFGFDIQAFFEAIASVEAINACSQGGGSGGPGSGGSGSGGKKHIPFVFAHGFAEAFPKPYSPVDPARYTHMVKAQSLDQLKRLIGISNDVHAQNTKLNINSRLRQRYKVNEAHLPATNFRISDLDHKQRLAVKNLKINLLYSFVNPQMEETHGNVIDGILGTEIPTFIGKDLLVCPGETVVFRGYAAAYFNNVVAVGNGKIDLGNSTLHAYQIKHIE